MSELVLDIYTHPDLFMEQDGRMLTFPRLRRDIREWFNLTGIRPAMGQKYRGDGNRIIAFNTTQTHNITLTFKDDVDRTLFEMTFMP